MDRCRGGRATGCEVGRAAYPYKIRRTPPTCGMEASSRGLRDPISPA